MGDIVHTSHIRIYQDQPPERRAYIENFGGAGDLRRPWGHQTLLRARTPSRPARYARSHDRRRRRLTDGDSVRGPGSSQDSAAPR